MANNYTNVKKAKIIHKTDDKIIHQ